MNKDVQSSTDWRTETDGHELTSYGGVEVLKVFHIPRALRRSQTLIVDLEEVPQCQLHV